MRTMTMSHAIRWKAMAKDEGCAACVWRRPLKMPHVRGMYQLLRLLLLLLLLSCDCLGSWLALAPTSLFLFLLLPNINQLPILTSSLAARDWGRETGRRAGHSTS
ncbi:hypothetical protein KR038_003875 [Drosophila bunnanda]|nr:hypothetical protein KR038_003875 [Drosophila bunnanda]